MRQIVFMCDMKNYDSWSPTSALMSLLVNINTDTKKNGASKPDDFNPYKHVVNRRKKKKIITEEESKAAFAMMKLLWVDNAPERKIKQSPTDVKLTKKFKGSKK